MNRKSLSLFLFLLFALGLHSQDSTTVSGRLIQFAKRATQFNRNFTQEKVYLHFDNTGYFLGETIWFKAYVVNASNNGFTNMSKTLYVDLLTPEGYVLQNTKLRIEDGVCNGEFLLQDSLKAGFYEVRAYTRCMMNFGPEVVFSRVFPIFDAPKLDGNYEDRNMTFRKFTIPDKREKAAKRERINVSFFPEGGSLVAGMDSKVAFKATDKQGKSIDITGKLLNDKGELITEFSTQHDGMGAFTMYSDGSKFTAKVAYKGWESKFQLPAPEPSGYVMSAFNLSNKGLRIMIQKSALLTGTDSMALVLTCRGQVYDFRILSINEQGSVFSYKHESLPPGVCQFTLYDSEGRIRSERLVFIQPKWDNKLRTTFDKKQYKPYEKIRLNLESRSRSEAVGQGSYSLAVRDGSTSNFGNSDNGNIVTNLLLSSDLKGFIENPSWYFADSTADRLFGLDLLMLTQGWRRYSWKRMEGLEPFKAEHPIEEGILMDGKVLSLLAKKEKKDIGVMFWMMQGNQSYKGNCVTDENGNFNFLLDMYGVWDLNLQTKLESKRKEYRILLNRAFSPEPRSYTSFDKEVWTNDSLKSLEPIPDSTALMMGEIKYQTETMVSNPQGYKEYLLKEVVKTAQKPLSMRQQAIRKASIGYDVKQIKDAHRDIGDSEAPTVLSMLEEENQYFSIMYDEDGGQGYRYKGRPVHFLFNDMPSELSGTRKVEELMGDEVEKVLIVEDQSIVHYYYPMDEKEHIIIMLQFYKNGIQRKEPIGIRKTTFQGYSEAREFYSPVYRPGIPIMEADHRRTLYWNPFVAFDSEGKAQLEFYNSATTKRMVISAEGISADGTLLLNE